MYSDSYIVDRIHGIVDPNKNCTAEEIIKRVEEKFTSTNTGSPKCYCCGSENVIIECGSCKERRVFGTWSEQ